MDERQIPEEHMTDPKHGYVVGGMFLLSKWIRENVEHPEPKFKIGDNVELKIEGEITDVYKDCDGTPLYSIDSTHHGYSEDSITASDGGEGQRPDGSYILTKDILFFEQSVKLVCDGNCKKAWGINSRPQAYRVGELYTQLSDEQLDELWDDEHFDIDDNVYLADSELGDAPDDPGSYEGGHAKPAGDAEKLNKWCARECERSQLVNKAWGEVIDPPDLSKRRYNSSPHTRD